jgi:hypothetical protein
LEQKRNQRLLEQIETDIYQAVDCEDGGVKVAVNDDEDSVEESMTESDRSFSRHSSFVKYNDCTICLVAFE